MNPKRILVVEGLDGCGKTLMTLLLKEKIEKESDYKVTIVKENEMPLFAIKLLNLILKPNSIFYWTIVRNKTAKYCRKLLKKNPKQIIIYDRYYFSTYVYQFNEFAKSPSIEERLNNPFHYPIKNFFNYIFSKKVNFFDPCDFNLLFIMSSKENASKRMKSRGELSSFDKFVIANYETLYDRYTDLTTHPVFKEITHTTKAENFLYDKQYFETEETKKIILQNRDDFISLLIKKLKFNEFIGE